MLSFIFITNPSATSISRPWLKATTKGGHCMDSGININFIKDDGNKNSTCNTHGPYTKYGAK